MVQIDETSAAGEQPERLTEELLERLLASATPEAYLSTTQTDDRSLADYLLDLYPRRIVKIHPALLPKYGGKGMWGHHVHEAVKAAGETETGITIHYVTPICDAGEIIAQFRTPLSPDDTPETIADKVHQLEMAHYPEVLEELWKAETYIHRR